MSEDNKNLQHNSLFIKALSRPSSFKVFLKHTLPEVYKKIDLKSLKIDNRSFVDDNLKELFADIVYHTTIEGKDTLITLLVEHKSYIDNQVVFQILSYILNIWKRTAKKRPLVVPIVIYNGAKKWTPKTFAQIFEVENTDLEKYLPDFKFEFISVRDLSDEFLNKFIEDAFLFVAFYLGKYIWAQFNELFQKTNYIFRVIIELNIDRKTKEKIFLAALQYLGSLNIFVKEPKKKQKIMELINEKENLGVFLEELFANYVEKEKYEKLKRKLEELERKEQEFQRTKQEFQKREQEFQRILLQRQKNTILKLYKQGFTVAQLSELLELDENFIKKVINGTV